MEFIISGFADVDVDVVSMPSRPVDNLRTGATSTSVIR